MLLCDGVAADAEGSAHTRKLSTAMVFCKDGNTVKALTRFLNTDNTQTEEQSNAYIRVPLKTP